MAVDADDEAVPFMVWPMDSSETGSARLYSAATARQAAERRAKDDYGGDPAWKERYLVRDGVTGQIWDVIVGVVQEPSFVAVTALRVPMRAATHVLWGGRVLCEDLRLRSVPRDWPEGQRWISLKDVADGAAAPADRCFTCWNKAPGFVEDLRQIGRGV